MYACSGLFKGRQARHLPWAPISPPHRGVSWVVFSFLMKNFLFAYTFSEAHHNLILCFQWGHQQQQQCVSTLLFKGAHNTNCNVQVLYF